MYKKVEGGEWEEAVRTKKTKVLVKGLKSRTKLEYDGLDEIDSYMLKSDRACEFQAVALNSTVTSLAKEYYFSAAEVSPAAMKAFWCLYWLTLGAHAQRGLLCVCVCQLLYISLLEYRFVSQTIRRP